MIRRFRCLIGFNHQRNTSSPSKRLLNAKPARVKPAMLETIQEVAIYIHRFHNLDLFQQGYVIYSFFFFTSTSFRLFID